MKYPEAMAYLESALRFGIKPGLERIKELLRRLGQPQERSKTFHIAGTNGKGSVSSYLTHILAAGGWRVGWFTSPYLERFTERIRIISGLEGIAEYAKRNKRARLTKMISPSLCLKLVTRLKACYGMALSIRRSSSL